MESRTYFDPSKLGGLRSGRESGNAHDALQFTTAAHDKRCEEVINALAALPPPPDRTTVTKFVEIYPHIERRLAEGVTQRLILKTLKDFGLSIHPAKFKKLLDDERAQRTADGQRICCITCNSPLQEVPAEESAQATVAVEQQP